MKKMVYNLSDGIAYRFGIADKKVEFNTDFNDAASGIGFMISQLAYLEQTMYEVPYADLFFDQVVPIRTDIPEWANNYQYISYDSAAQGKFIGSHAKDLPTSALERKIHTTNLAYGGLSLTYSLDDMRKTQHLGMNLEAEQAIASYRGAREHQQRVVFYGDAAHGMTGFLNNPNVGTYTANINPKTASVDSIADQINTVINKIWVDSNQRFVPDTVCLDSATFARLSVMRMSETVPVISALEYLAKYNLYTARTGQKLQFIPMPQLSADEMKANGLTAKTTMVVYAKNPTNLVSFMPIAPRFIAPQAVGLEIVTPMEYKIGGTEWRYPQSAMYVNFAE